MRLQDFLVRDALIPALHAGGPDEAVTELLDALIEAGAVPGELRDELLEMFLERERTGSTGFGKGVAVPHVKHEKLTRMVGAIGVSESGMDFNALDLEPVYCVVMLLSPRAQPDEHLQAMEQIFTHLQSADFRRSLRHAGSADDLEVLIQSTDTEGAGSHV